MGGPIHRLREGLERVYRRLNRLSRGYLGVVRAAAYHFGQRHAPEAAAGMAFYAFFSLFPLLLFFIALGTLFLEEEQVYREVVSVLSEAIPISRRLIEDNVQQALDTRGPVTALGVLGTLWSGSGLFRIVVVNVNRAWPEAAPRSYLSRHGVALAMLGMLLLLVLLSTVAVSVLNFLSTETIPSVSPLVTAVVTVVSLLTTFAFFVLVYRWVPNTGVRWSSAAVAGAVAGAAWRLAADTFGWYVRSGIAGYEVVYGSLGAIVALLFWIYLSSLIVLFGAYLGGALDARRDVEERAATD